MFVGRLHTNCKGEIDVTLGARTIVVGAPASHKSGLVSALQLALTGEADDVGKQPSEIIGLAPPGTELFATLWVYNAAGQAAGKVGYRVTGSTAKAQKPRLLVEGLSNPPGVFLGQVVRKILHKSTRAQREAILSVATPKDLLVSARASVPEAFVPAWDRLVAEARSSLIAALAKGIKSSPDGDSDEEEQNGATDADVIVKVADLCRAAVREANKLSKADLGTAPAVLSEAEHEALRFRVHDLETREKAARERSAARERLARLQAEIEVARARQQAATAAQGLPPPALVQAAKTRMQAVALIQSFYLESRYKGPCLVTGTPVDLAEEGTIGQVEVTRADLQAAVQARQEREQKIAAAEQALAAVAKGSDLVVLEAEAVDLASKVARIDTAIGVTTTESDLAAALTAAREALEAEDRARAAQSEHDARALSVAKAEADKTMLAALSKTADRIVAESLQKGIDLFVSRASAALPSGKIAIQLFDKGRSVCRVGLHKDGAAPTSWKYLSGQERAGTIGAFAGAWARAETAPVKIVAIDDVWLDAAGLAGICAGLGRVVGTPEGPTQAIVCAVTLYDLPAPEGWTVVRV